MPTRSFTHSPAHSEVGSRLEASGPTARCTNPAAPSARRVYRGPPDQSPCSGGPGLDEERNPLSDTTEVTTDVTSGGASAEAEGAGGGTTRRRRTGGGLASMLLPELQSMAVSLGISGTARMRKGELVTAIQERQAGT